MSKFNAPDYRTLLAVACLVLSACQPVGNPSTGAAVPQGPQSDDPDTGIAARDLVPAASTRALAVAEKAEIYAFAAAIDPERIAESIDEARREPDPDRREVLINALTERLAEIDPVQAIDTATSLEQNFRIELLGPLFATVAKVNPDAAIDALADLADRGELETIHPLAMIVLEEIRGDSRLLEAWLRAIPSESQFYEWIRQREDLFELSQHGFAALAAVDPDLLLNRIQTMSDADRRFVDLDQVAVALARHDARYALDRIERVRDEGLRTTMRHRLLRSWASTEPMAALNYLAALDRREDDANADRQHDFRLIAEAALSTGVDPEQILALSMQMPAENTIAMRAEALEALAARDPIAASAWLDEIPAQWQRPMIGTVAFHYAARDPMAAFQWSQQHSPVAEQYVLGAIAASNPGMALDFALGGTTRSRANAVDMVLVYAVQANPDEAPALAQRIRQSLAGSALYDSAISTLAGTWMQMDAEAALEWLAAPGVNVPDTAYQAAARALRNDPSRAAAIVGRVPVAARQMWIEEVTSNFVRTDLEGAIAWIEQHRSDPNYALGAVAVVEGVAEYDASRAARLFATLPATADRQRVAAAADKLASSWANTDPRAAASWASGLDDDGLRRRALMNVTVAWSRNDPDTARSWILSQPSSSDRDGALQSYLTATARNGLPDADLLDKFSSDEALGRAVTNVLGNSPTLDPAAARDWLEGMDLPTPVRERVAATVAQIELMREENPEMRDSLLLLPPRP